MGGEETRLKGVPYDRLALVYDAIPPGQAYQSVLQQALELFRDDEEIRTILDLACGTGSAAVALHAMGYQAIGMDRSPGMVQAARRKAEGAGEKLDFRVADMRDFSLEHPVDAVISTGDAVNHLLEKEDIKSCFSAVARGMRSGGWFVFDVNTLHGLKDWDSEVYTLHNQDFAYICECVLSEDLMTVNTTFFLPDPAPPHFYRHEESFMERAWPLTFLKACLQESGFEPLHCWGWQTQAPGGEGDRHVTLAARRQ